MGYTHYWTFKPIPKGQAKQVEANYQLALRQCSRVIKKYNAQFPSGDYRRLSGYSAHCKVGQYGGLHFNGCKDEAHEDFTMREHYTQNLEDTNNFCKTARKPYDDVVVACICIMKHYLGDLFKVVSDGCMLDWDKGLILARITLKMRNIRMPQELRYCTHRH